jgi:hypothetical protein
MTSRGHVLEKEANQALSPDDDDPEELAAHAKQALARGDPAEAHEQTRQALSELPKGSLGTVATESFYFDQGDRMPPCPLCEHWFRYFIQRRLLRPEQIRSWVAPAVGRR